MKLEPKAVADAVVARLFENGFGEKADRLQLMGKVEGAKERNLGGWCREAARDQIVLAIGDIIAGAA